MKFHREELDDFVFRQAEEAETTAKHEHKHLSRWSVNVLHKHSYRR